MLSALLQATELGWKQVPQRAFDLAKAASPAARRFREAGRELPQDSFLDVFYAPEKDVLFVDFGKWASPGDEIAAWEKAGQEAAILCDWGIEAGPPSDGYVWVKVASQPPGVLFQKRAYSPTLRALLSAGGYTPDYYGGIPGAPSPLAAALASGMLGSAAGYGTGWVAEKFMPEKWKRNRLRRTLAVLGGLGAAAPAGLWGAVSFAEMGPKGLVSGWPLDTPLKKQALAGPNPFTEMGAGETGAFLPPIDAAAVVRSVHTPPVSQQLPPETRAATTGLMVGAGHHQTGGQYMPRFVSPMAVGRMAAGMGSGWLSGMLVGKVLGALTGMPDSAQQRLRNTGMWAGAISNLVPLVFPGR